jgi:biopolymer transport protein TolR
MRWNETSDERPGMHDVNLTPLIDVSLVLVVILLLATPLAFESNFAVKETSAAARAADQETPVPRIELTILSDDAVRLNRDVVSLAEFGPAIGAILKSGGTRDVTVTCDGAVTHGTFVRVLDLTKLNGARDVAVTGS